MNWILIGTLLGSLITSTHDTREACEGRTVTLKEKGVSAKCVEAPGHSFTSSTGTMMCCGVSLCGPCK